MDDTRGEIERLQEATRWLLVVLVGACVLAAGVLAVTDVPGLVGRRWQLVGAVSAAVTGYWARHTILLPSGEKNAPPS